MILAKLRNNPIEWLKDVFPIAKWLPKYKLTNIPYDFIAGLTVALTLLPISLAYAQMASLRTEYGLYSSFLAQFLYIFMGTSKDAIIGPSAINSMLVGQFNALNPLSPEGDNTYSVILSFTSGIILFLIGVLKLGFIVNLFSIPVVSGFTTAACFTIIASQFKSFFGLKSAPNDAPAMFIRQCKNVYDQWHTAKYLDIYFGVASLLFLLFAEYSQKLVFMLISKCREPKSPMAKKIRTLAVESFRIFIASRNIMVFVPATGVAYYLISLDPEYEHKITVVGHIKQGLPIPRFPRFTLYNHSNESQILQTPQEVISNLSVAFIIQPLMIMMEMFAILKALARKNGYRLDATNELVTVGIGNFLQSFIQAYPITAATAKSVLNDQCKVKSLLSTLISVFLIILAIEELTGIFYFVPKAVLAAILIAAAHHLFDYETVIHIYKEYKPDLFMFTITFLLCLFYDLAYGILIAILLNMVTFLRPIVRMDFSVTREPLLTGPNGEVEYVTVIQLSHGMKYPSVDKFIDRMTRIMASHEQHYVIDCRFVSGIDFTGLQAWRTFLRMVYMKKKHVIFANLLPSVLHQLEAIGLEHFRYVEDIESAVGAHNVKDSIKDGDNEKEHAINGGRLNHRISIVPSSGHLSISNAQRQESIAVGDVIQSIVEDSNNKASTGSHTLQEELDRKEQEDRLMKVLSFQTHFLHDISIDCENPSDNDGGNESDEEKETEFQQPSHLFQNRGFSIVSIRGEPARYYAQHSLSRNHGSKSSIHAPNDSPTRNLPPDFTGTRRRGTLNSGGATVMRSSSHEITSDETQGNGAS